MYDFLFVIRNNYGLILYLSSIFDDLCMSYSSRVVKNRPFLVASKSCMCTAKPCGMQVGLLGSTENAGPNVTGGKYKTWKFGTGKWKTNFREMVTLSNYHAIVNPYVLRTLGPVAAEMRMNVNVLTSRKCDWLLYIYSATLE